MKSTEVLSDNWKGTFIEDLVTRPLNDIRIAYLDKATQIGLPDSKTEYWKYTRIQKYVQKKYNQPVPSSLPNIPSLFKTEHHITVKNGFLIENSCRIGEIKIEVLNDQQTGENFNRLFENNSDVFPHLNRAFCNDIVKISVLPKAEIDATVHVRLIHDDASIAFPRIMIEAGKLSKSSFVFTIETADDSEWLTIPVIEIFAQESSHLEYLLIEDFHGNDQAAIVNLASQHAANSTISGLVFNINGKLIRNNINHHLTGGGAEAKLYGLYTTHGRMHADNHTFIEHAVANAHSDEKFKGVLTGRSRAVFNGKVLVRQDAQKTQAYQANDNIMLSDEAEVDAKPELEIYADDVKCSHGCTVGKLDDSAMFYMQTRGISVNMARKLLIQAFAGEIIEKVSHENIKSKIYERLEQILEI